MSAAADDVGLICALLRRERPPWIGGPDRAHAFEAQARYHGVLPLLADHLGACSDWPSTIVEAARSEARNQAVLSLAVAGEVTRLVAAFGKAGLTPLILKGTAFAYDLYADPALRPRSDIDLLVAPSQQRGAEEALSRLGYERCGGVYSQSSWRAGGGGGLTHLVDLHWRSNPSPLLASLLNYEEMLLSSVPLAALGPGARGLGPVHALLFACVHRAGHRNAPVQSEGVAHPGWDRIIWLYDILLLLKRLPRNELDEAAGIAIERRMAGIVRDALQASVEQLGAAVPPQLLERLSARAGSEPSSRYFAGGRARQMLGDFFALRDAAERRQWLREVAFPTPDHVRELYPDARLTWLPLLYARRAVVGVSRVLSNR